MKVLRSARWLLLALLLSVVPASSFAGVFISVGFAPPVLPVYVQPACPEPGLMWSPGYWAYGDDGYYWVPGAWVPAPYEGALWTPPYWGWSGGLYVFHEGYWGRHVGYYGGVNYGFGYMGIGFVGGEWHGHDFAYNRAVVNVNTTVIHNTYINKTVVNNTTIINNNHVAYSGGPGGIRHEPTPQEQQALHESHVAPTSFQQQHIQAARTDHNSYFKANAGHPQNVVASRPLPAEHHSAPQAASVNAGAGARGQYNAHPGSVPNGSATGRLDARPAPVGRPEAHTAPGYQPQAHPAPQPRYEPQSRPAPTARYDQARPVPESRPAPQPRYEQSRPVPQSRPAPQPHYEQSRPAPQARPEPQSHPEPAPHNESRPKEPHR
jgi:WXXGXW repeat (2 copies)